MSEAHGKWLRQQRQACGWNVPKMGRKLREAAEAMGDILPGKDGLAVMVHRWEDDRSGISERYRLHYCRAFQIPADSYGDPATLGGLHVNGSVPGDIVQPGEERLEAVMTTLCWQSLTGAPDQPPPRPVGLRDQVRAALDELADPAERDQLCFLLGYACAAIAAASPGRAVPGQRPLPGVMTAAKRFRRLRGTRRVTDRASLRPGRRRFRAHQTLTPARSVCSYRYL